MKGNRHCLIVLCLLFSMSSYSQIDNYIIITFEFDRKIEPIENYYWITPIDSIKQSDFVIYPLYIDEYSKDDLDECISSDTINIFIATGISNYNFEEDYENSIIDLISLTKRNRLKVQVVDTEWVHGKEKQKLNIYVTPISGYFCKCMQNYKRDGSILNPLIFLPVSDFSFNKDYWKTKEASIVKFANYSYVDFKIQYPNKSRGVRIKIE